MSNLNFSEFQPMTQDEWRSLVEKELKGRSADEIAWKGAGFYIDALQLPSSQHMISAASRAQASWLVRQDFDTPFSVEEVEEAINSGVEVVGLRATDSGPVAEFLDVQRKTSCVLRIRVEEVEALGSISKLMESRSLGSDDAVEIPVFSSGSFTEDKWELGAPWFSHARMRVVVDGVWFRNQGADLYQELVWMLSGAHNVLLRMMAAGMSAEEAIKKIAFETGLGSDYFEEMCKTKVLRMLWSAVVNHYLGRDYLTSEVQVMARTSTWNKPGVDVDTNLIRLTTEAMSAIIGGADVLAVETHDGAASKDSLRWARNIQWLLKYESRLDAVCNPMAGSYFFEELVERMADKCWASFQRSEALFEANMRSGKIAEAMRKRALDDKEAVESGAITVIGVNRFTSDALKISKHKLETRTSSMENRGN